MASLEIGTVRLDIPSRIHMLETADLLVSHLATAAGFDQDSAEGIGNDLGTVPRAARKQDPHATAFDASGDG